MERSDVYESRINDAMKEQGDLFKVVFAVLPLESTFEIDGGGGGG
jgi:hypothetical protein